MIGASRHYPDAGGRYAQYAGGAVSHLEVALRAAPDSYAAIRHPPGRGGVRLNVALVNCLGPKLFLDDYVGLAKSLVNVAHAKLDVTRDVALELVAAALKQGMRSLRISGAQKVSEGLTTLEEIFSVIPDDLDKF